MLDTLQIKMFSNDVRESFDTENKHDDGYDGDLMMLVTSRKFITCCEMWPAVQDGWFHLVRRNLSLDVDKFWSTKKTLTNAWSHLHMPAAKTKKKKAKYWEQGKTLGFGQ